MKRNSKLFPKFVSLLLVIAMTAVIFPFMAKETHAALSQNQANIIARADYMYNSTWVCKKTMTSWKGQSYFYEGNTYRIPYAWPVTAGKWVGLTSYGNAVTIDTFLEATKDPTNIFYTQQSYYSGNAGSYAPYYGNDCSTFVSYSWGLAQRKTTSSIVNASGVSLIGKITTNNVNNFLCVGDALNYAGSHIVLVTDIVCDASGAITSIEITEQTPPQLKRTNHTVASLVSKYGANYKIYRYSGTVSAPTGTGASSAVANPDNYTVPTSTLSYGSYGTDVSWVQAVLNHLGYSLTVDGDFGNATAAAIAYFQMDYGLPVSCSADTVTIDKLKTLWADKTGYYNTTASSLNMRAGDGTSYSVICTIPQDSSVTVIGFNSAGTWANIIYNGVEGWVSKSYLSFVRKFNYTANYNTNVSATIDSVSFTHDRILQVANPPASSGNTVLAGWQLLRASDWVWYNGSTWVSDQGSSKLYQPGEHITFSRDMLNPKAGDDAFYLCAVWKDASSVITSITPSEVSPDKYGWQWPSAEAYGFLGGYGKNGQDIELCFDLAFLPSSATPSVCFYTDGTAKSLNISPDSARVGNVAASVNWGEISLDNWHDVKFKILNGYAYIFIDGNLVACDYGYTANESYQLLFSLTGEMAIDNVMMMSSSGTTYFSCDFEDERAANNLMGSGLGSRALLFPDVDAITLEVSPKANKITEKGKVSFKADATGEGLTYKWTSSDPSLNPYLEGADTATLTVNIKENLDAAISANITCTVTNKYGKSLSDSVLFEYEPKIDDPYKDVILGDIDGNGVANSMDVNIMKRLMSGTVTATPIQMIAGDLNNDGKVNSSDAYLLTRLVAGSL